MSAAVSPDSTTSKLTRMESILVEGGLVSADALRSAKDRQRGAKRPLVEVLVEQGALDEEKLVGLLAEMSGFGTAAAAAADLKPSPEVQHLVPSRVASLGVLPLYLEDDVLVVATADPTQVVALDEIASRSNRKLRVLVAKPRDLREAMRHVRKGEDALHEVLKNAPEEGDDLEFSASPVDGHAEHAVDAVQNDSRVVRLVNMMVADAVRGGASDIHVEPEKDRVRIRFRVDGELREVSSLPPSLHASIASRIKIMAGLDITENRRPQDGRVRVVSDEKPYDLRVSTLPTYFGEKIVMRVLDPSKATFDLDRCGIAQDTVAAWRGLLRRPHGLLLMTGPTGSGKTSTLFASLLEVRDPSINITTVEDPVEYQFAGIAHVPVRADIGMTFAAALRSILRQDPDVVLLGEIRDKETAQVAVQAAMTGHLVLSTLHTNDAVGAVTRLIDLGIDPQLVAASVLGVMAQRLARTVCEGCAAPAVYAAEELAPLGLEGPLSVPKGRGAGCGRCGGTGYRGRTALAELVVMTPELSKLVSSGAMRHELREQARLDGTRDLVQSGAAKIVAGVTTPAEVLCVAVGETTAQIRPHAPAARRDPAPAKDAPPCVLVADDDPTTRRLVELALRVDFPDVVHAADGAEALEKIAARRPDVLVVDQEMPGRTGVQVIRALRSHIATVDLPIVMLTASQEEEIEIESLDAGADDYLRKPVSAPRLRARVAAIVAARRRAAESES